MFPFFLLLIGTCFQAALWYSARNAALASSQEGLRAARARQGAPGAGEAAALAFAAEVADGQLLNPSARVSVDGDQTVAVTVTGEVWSFVPGLNIRVTQVARGPKERWTPAGEGRR
ncbi:pilus assembly protein [Actinomadura chibensis]|uniref:Pilus assembly protein n=1 Tax=Actinomadura chibensis TaxID=392828 RepID=A0A5D0NWJ9_9ACTN|nr:pilus assembly protein [Actinomadura chibensis]TYB48548.1 pilus assembly protein [Actinomadura chibensis]